MCIAIVKPAGKVLSEARLRTCFENNPDGAGFAVKTPAGLVTVKGFFDIEAFLVAYRQYAVDANDALVHFRITTRGDGAADNCHPFALSCGALIHNGTIGGLGERGVGKSDTRVLAEQLFHEDFATLKRLAPIIEAYIDDTRVAFMSHNGETLVLNSDQWVEDDGVLYSNHGYKPYTRSLYPSLRRTALDDDDVYTSAYTELVVPDEVYLLNTVHETTDEGFAWLDNELWVEAHGDWWRDNEAEELVLDAWYFDFGGYSYPTEQDVAEVIHLTREILEDLAVSRADERDTPTTQKAA